MKPLAYKVYGAVLVASFVFCLFILAPAPLLLSSIGVQSLKPEFNVVRGTVWRGQSASVLLNGTPVGALEYELHPWSVLALNPAFVWSMRDTVNLARGTFKTGVSGLVIEETTVEVSLSALRLPVQMVGQATLTLERLSLSDLRCNLADGFVALAGRTVGTIQEQVDLTGPVVCEDGALVALLSGSFGAYPARVSLTYQPGASVDYSVSLSGVETSAGAGLTAIGFQQNGPAYELAGRTTLFP